MTDMVERIITEINHIEGEKGRAIAAIDGRCASGKTTLANELSKRLGCVVFHMDDFFLRPEQRTEKRYSEPGGNVDCERFLKEVFSPLSRGEKVIYQPFDCKTMSLTEAQTVFPTDIVIIEGTYSCHPDLWGYADLHIFLDITPNEQLMRLEKRCPERLTQFIEKWIPLEERYFTAFDIASKCEIKFDT